MGHTASAYIIGKKAKETNHYDAVSPQRFSKISSDFIHESEASLPGNAIAQKQRSSLEKSDLNREHRERPMNASSSHGPDDEEGRYKENYKKKIVVLEAEVQQLREENDRLMASSSHGPDDEEGRYKENYKKKIVVLEAEVQQLREENDRLMASSSHGPDDEEGRYKENYKKKIVVLEAEVQQLREENDRLMASSSIGQDDEKRTYKESYETKIAVLEAEVQELRDEKDGLMASSRHEQDYEEGRYKENYETKIAVLETEVQELREKKDGLMASSPINLDESGLLEKDYKKRIKSLEAEVQQLKEEKHKLFTRLSEIGAVMLTENNPNIANLSDANRPNKLAEQFSELYDNEWTDAFEYLTQTVGWQDEKTVRRLLNILQKIYKICLKSTRKQADDLKKAVLSYLGLSEENKDDVTVKETEKRLREYRATQFESALGCVTKDVRHQLKDELDGKVHGTLDKYIQKCTRLCWFMGIKDPQMHLDFYRRQRNGPPVQDANDFPLHFDTAKFVNYTKTGMYLEYVVWPAVYLYKDGPIMKRGVAQGLNREPEVKESTVEKKGETSNDIGDKIDIDQGQNVYNSNSDITKNKDQDGDISYDTPCTDDVALDTVNENTQYLNSLDFNGHDLSDGKQSEGSSNENTAATISGESYQDEGLSHVKDDSKEDENFRNQDESPIEEPIFGDDVNTGKGVFAGSKGREYEGE